MSEILQKLIDLLKYLSWWFDEYIFSGLIKFFKAIGYLIIKILEFFIDIIQWLMSHI